MHVGAIVSFAAEVFVFFFALLFAGVTFARVRERFAFCGVGSTARVARIGGGGGDLGNFGTALGSSDDDESSSDDDDEISATLQYCCIISSSYTLPIVA